MTSKGVIQICHSEESLVAETAFWANSAGYELVGANGREALRKGQSVLYVTERAVFSLQQDGLHVEEIAPGVDLQTQVLDLIPFKVIVPRTPRLMASRHFS